MSVEETSPGIFAITDLTADQVELLQSGLIEVEKNSLQADEFAADRASCFQMFRELDNALIQHRS